MTDIDFDELDKAVNNLMGTVGTSDKEEGPKEKTFTVSSTLQPGEKPSYDKLGEVAKQIGSETLIGKGELTTVEDLPDPVAVGSAVPDVEVGATQQTDTVTEPESTTETQTELQAEQEAADAETATESEQSSDPEAESQPEQEIRSEIPTVPTVKRPNSGRFMDVVHPSSDMRSPDTPALNVPERSGSLPASSSMPSVVAPGNDVITPPEPTKQDLDTQAEKATDLAAMPMPEPIAEPIPLTPFLPGAKVEKRPLGEAPAIVEEPKDEVIEGSDEELDEPNKSGDAQRTLDPSDFSVSSKAENDELLRLELTTDVPEKETPSELSENTPAVTTLPDTVSASGLSIQQIESGDTEHLSGGTIPVMATVEQPIDDATSGDVYGVKQQGSVVEHPAKQKSGWGTVIIIILVIVALAGVGVAAYFVLGAGS